MDSMVVYLMLSIIAVLAFLCVSHALPEMMSGKLAQPPPPRCPEQSPPQNETP